MNNFTMDELTDLLFCVKDHTGYQGDSIHENLIKKIQSRIDNYRDDPWKTRKIAESHLREAESLISHARCLLDMKEEA